MEGNQFDIDRYLLTLLIAVSMIETALADLGYMHASNHAWPPHAKFHAIWAVMHVAAIHLLARRFLWTDSDAQD